ncbi:SHO1 [Ceraceosorus bombacis]|uniref:SHO1 n=1 Tax=Ceraceosorus bombacis TaxID=401625 RepID=A0A0P1BAM9_9BASI|nr:SHO1 [Ceraceosorus bombacis]
MARNGGGGGFDFSLLASNLILGGSIGIAAIGWFVAFIGQIVAQARTNDNVPRSSGQLGVLWFGIFVELFLLIGVILTIATDTIAISRLQISAWTAVGLVFSVIGIDKGIYSDVGSLEAMAAGYFILTVVNVIWLLFFTSEEDSAVYAALSSVGSGGLSGPGARGGAVGGGRQMRMAGGSGAVGMGSGSGGFASGGGAYQQAYVNSPSTADVTSTGRGLGTSAGVSGAGAPSSQSVRSGSVANRGAGANAASGPGSEYAGSQAHAPGSPTGSKSADADPNSGYGYRARALYAYQANADDPTEISFAKGELLDIVDNSGKWWQARKSTGETGIVPSNYMQLL